MRLTLRTLLAYLDDILEPTQTKEIGAKIAESEDASALVGRIRDVMRRRRVTAPDLEVGGSQLDSNTVAEYLDNTLPPARVVGVEKVCLESDTHLAEVAACHQILTLVLGEPVDILPDCRKRMYALGSTTPDDGNGRSTSAAITVDGGEQAAPESQVAEPAASQAAAPEKPFADQIPDYLKPKPLWRRALIPCAVVLFVVLIVTDPHIFTRVSELLFTSEDQPVAQNAVDAAAASDEPDDGQVTDVAEQEKPLETDEPAAEPVRGGEAPQVASLESGRIPETDRSSDLPNELDVAMPAAEPEPTDETREAVPLTEEVAPPPPSIEPPAGDEQSDAAADRQVAVVAPRPSAETQPPAPEPEVPAVPPLLVQLNSGFLLHYDQNRQGWIVGRPPSTLNSIGRIAVPEPFESMLGVGNRLRVTVLSDSSLQLLGPSEAARFGIELQRGRVVVESVSASALEAERPADAPNTMFAQAVGGKLWRVEMLSTGTVCGVEIVPREPEAFEQDLGRDNYAGRLYVAAGSIRFVAAGGRAHVIEAPGSMSLAVGELEAFSSSEAKEAPPAAPEPPAWMNPAKRRLQTAARRYGRTFQREFVDDQPMLFSIHTTIRDARPEIAELAVKTLATTGSYESLVQALAETTHEESRAAAIVGLRQWLGQSPEHGKLLHKELGQWFEPDLVETIYRLLWGYGENDARDLSTSTQLVQWLEHDQVVVRQLAFYHVRRLTGQTYQYNPQMLPLQRNAAVNRWQAHVERRQGLLEP